jgi:hypothetical protein
MKSESHPPPSASHEHQNSDVVDVFGTGPRVELPKFDGSNPHLWQDRCEDYFTFWGTPPHMWIQYASAQFEWVAARWLEAARRRIPQATWQEFCSHLMLRFGRNQHRTLVRRLIQISQSTTVLDYVERFSALYDQLSAYEIAPDSMHYTTRFIDGLKPAIRMAVAIQQPHDLDSAVELALLYEELEDNSAFVSAPSSPAYTPTAPRRGQPSPVQIPVRPPPPRVAEVKPADAQKTSALEDRWQQLRAYRKAKVLCFTCGEKWARDHQCRPLYSSMLYRKCLNSCKPKSSYIMNVKRLMV